MLHQTFRTDYDHYQGCPFAPIELVEYGDFQCKYCAKVYPAIKLLQGSFGHLLRFVYRHFPIPSRHSLSVPAAVATEAAASRGKFWYMHDMIFENQKYLTRTSFSVSAREISLDIKSFEDCREHQQLFRKFISDFEGGIKSGVDRTPTFFIKGARYVGFDDFESLYSALQNINYYEKSRIERPVRVLK
jgi:protein-disulfide isomerase